MARPFAAFSIDVPDPIESNEENQKRVAGRKGGGEEKTSEATRQSENKTAPRETKNDRTDTRRNEVRTEGTPQK